MFLLESDFRKYLCILLIITIVLGTGLVNLGGYLTDSYFSRMVSGVIGDYGEYDLLLTLASDKEDIAREQVENVIETSFPGGELKEGPRVAGSSNYLLRFPDEYRTGEIYANLGSYFSGIPGLMSKTIITEPRLTLRGFRGKSLAFLRPKIEKIEGIDFSYASGDGLDLVIEEPGLVPSVKKEVRDILNDYELFEVRYPLNKRPENPDLMREELSTLLAEQSGVSFVQDVSSDGQSDTMSLLRSLKQMKGFLLSFATRIIVNNVDFTDRIETGRELVIQREDAPPTILRVIESEEGKVEALLKEGSLEGLEGLPAYLHQGNGQAGERLGKVVVNNPRQELALTLEQLNEITPRLDDFMDRSEKLVEFSGRLNSDLENINQGLSRLEETGESLNQSLNQWQQDGLTHFLEELLIVLEEIRANVGDLNQVQTELIKTSNRLKEAARLIEEKIVFIPRGSEIYRQLSDLKEMFLKASTGLDENYDLIAERTEDMDPVLSSIDDWQVKINSLISLESTLAKGKDWQEVEEIVNRINETASVLDTRNLQDSLVSIQDLLMEVKGGRLPQVIEQLEYIRDSLPDLDEEEIVDTLELIDSYLAGRVIPGEQIQLLVKGSYNNKVITEKAREMVAVPGVSYFNMDAGMLQTNPRAEVFNVLRQVRAVISTIIALIFTLLVLILDQSLLVSVLRLQGSRGYLFSFLSGGTIFSLIYYLSKIDFPYLSLPLNFILGGLLGLLVGLFAGMLNPVSSEEWEAGKALGYSPDEIMREIVIPAGKPGLLYLLNRPRVIFK